MRGRVGEGVKEGRYIFLLELVALATLLDFSENLYFPLCSCFPRRETNEKLVFVCSSSSCSHFRACHRVEPLVPHEREREVETKVVKKLNL